MAVEPNLESAAARKRLSSNLRDVLELRSLPETALRINEACRNQQFEIDLLVDMIQCDPNIASRILVMVNSPLFGSTREVDSIRQAVVMLGFKKLSELVSSIASQQVFEMDPATRSSGIAIFQHSLACATAAGILYQITFNQPDAGAAFLAGMLHDVGKLFFFDLAPQTYSQMVIEPSHPQLSAQEQAIFGTTHAELGHEFAVISDLPLSIRLAIQQHHGGKDSKQAILAQVTDLANSLVKTWGIGMDVPHPPNRVAAQWMEDLDESTVNDIRESIQLRFELLQSIFLS